MSAASAAFTAFSLGAIPISFQKRKQWVCWRAVDKGDRIEKIPVNPNTGGAASTTDSTTWTDCATAARYAEQHGLGIGFVFVGGTEIVGVDLDKCRDPETGEIESWALEIVRALDSYTEVSPSGRGVHIFVLGELPPGRRRKERIEAYETVRFFTVTGNRLPETPPVLMDRDDELKAFHAKYLADPEPEPAPTSKHTTPTVRLEDEAILEKCRAAKNAGKFEALWRGDHTGYASHSEADLALLGILAFYSQDSTQLARLFRMSGLMREKWDERHGEMTYGEKTISECLKHIGEVYAPSHHTPSEGSVLGLMVQSSEVWPEIQPVKTEIAPVEPLPLGITPAPFRDWIEDTSTRMQCPPDYVAAAMLVMASAIVGAACGIRPKQHDDWEVVPNLWGGVVGRPSMLKTPASAEAMRPLDQLERAAKLAYDTARKQHEADIEIFKAHKDALQADMRKIANGKGKAGQSMDGLKYDFSTLEEPPHPAWRRYRTNDGTIEKIADLLKDNPRGLLVFRDELVGQLAAWDREGHEPDRAFFLEAWNGNRPYTCDRIGRGTIFIDNLCLSLFGGIQPSKLTYYLHQAMRGTNNDGLVQRLQLLVYPDEPKGWRLVDTPVKVEAKNQVHRVVERLASMDFRQQGAFCEEGHRPYYRFDGEAQGLFNEWLTGHEAKLRQGDEEPVVVEHLAKYRSLMPSLALIFHLIDLADSHTPCQVTKKNAEIAAAWCEYLESHARRVYSLVTNATNQAASRLAAKIREKALPDQFSVRTVYLKGWGLLSDRQLAKDACEELVSLGWLKERVTPPAQGQRGKVEYAVNPKVRAL